MKNVVALVLGGGRGTRLYPLTKVRSKPAVPVAGKYRLIDIPLSNCINSGLNKIHVVTQFNSVSLHHHMQAYRFSAFSRGYVEILAAQQTSDNMGWYQGTADAVRQNLNYIQQRDVDYVLILSGDQLYHMDFRDMLKSHEEAGADVTISAVPVHRNEASELGIMKLDDTGRVVGFLEKPQTEKELEHVATDPAWIDQQGIQSNGRDCLASMGIYLFNRDTLLEALEKTDYQDFGKEVFPATMRTRRVQVHMFDGYWEDIGTIKSFYQANLDLAKKNPPFALFAPDSPILTRARFLPPSRLDGVMVRESLIADGCQIEEGAVIENSIIGLRCSIGPKVVIKNSIIMGNDFFETEDELVALDGVPPIGIGENSRIEGAIVDKNCRIGQNVTIINSNNVQDTEEGQFGMIRDGIVCIPKETVIPDNCTLDQELC